MILGKKTPGGLPKPVKLQWTWVDATWYPAWQWGGRSLTRCSALRSETSRNSTCCWYNRCAQNVLKSFWVFVCSFLVSDAMLGINVWLQEHFAIPYPSNAAHSLRHRWTLQVEAISKAMKQRAADLKLPMPQLVVGQNIETWASPVVYQFETTHLKAGSPLFRTIPYPGKT